MLSKTQCWGLPLFHLDCSFSYYMLLQRQHTRLKICITLFKIYSIIYQKRIFKKLLEEPPPPGQPIGVFKRNSSVHFVVPCVCPGVFKTNYYKFKRKIILHFRPAYLHKLIWTLSFLAFHFRMGYFLLCKYHLLHIQCICLYLYSRLQVTQQI